MADDTTESVTDGTARPATDIQAGESGATSETARIDSETVVEAHEIKKSFDGDGEDGGVLRGVDLDVQRGDEITVGPLVLDMLHVEHIGGALGRGVGLHRGADGQDVGDVVGARGAGGRVEGGA